MIIHRISIYTRQLGDPRFCLTHTHSHTFSHTLILTHTHSLSHAYTHSHEGHSGSSSHSILVRLCRAAPPLRACAELLPSSWVCASGAQLTRRAATPAQPLRLCTASPPPVVPVGSTLYPFQTVLKPRQSRGPGGTPAAHLSPGPGPRPSPGLRSASG